MFASADLLPLNGCLLLRLSGHFVIVWEIRAEIDRGREVRLKIPKNMSKKKHKQNKLNNLNQGPRFGVVNGHPLTSKELLFDTPFSGAQEAGREIPAGWTKKDLNSYSYTELKSFRTWLRPVCLMHFHVAHGSQQHVAAIVPFYGD